MPRYTVTQNYSAERAAASVTQFGPWIAGDEVELDEPDAEWVNTDSAGTLTPTSKSGKTKKSPPAASGGGHSTADASGLTKGG